MWWFMNNVIVNRLLIFIKQRHYPFQLLAPAPTRRQRRLQGKKDKHIVAKATAMVIPRGAQHTCTHDRMCLLHVKIRAMIFCKGAHINRLSKCLCVNLQVYLI